MLYIIYCNTIAKKQFGFRAKHSTSHVILDVTNKFKTLRDKKNYSCLILLDLSKAFDTVNHSILIKKLEKCGIRGNSLKLEENYLTNKKQFVIVNQTPSKKLTISCGVAQGSVLHGTTAIFHLHQ